MKPDRTQGKSMASEVFDLVEIARTMKGGRLEQMLRESSDAAESAGQKFDLPTLVRLLIKHGAEFIVIGGYAVAFHGAPRFTKDLDIIYHTTRENIGKILSAFDEHGIRGKATIADLLGRKTNFKIGFPPDQLDMCAEEAIKGVPSWEEAWNKSVEGELAGTLVRFLDLEHLIQAKKAAGRPLDLVDIDRLMNHLGEF